MARLSSRRKIGKIVRRNLTSRNSLQTDNLLMLTNIQTQNLILPIQDDIPKR